MYVTFLLLLTNQSVEMRSGQSVVMRGNKLGVSKLDQSSKGNLDNGLKMIYIWQG